MLGRLRDQYQVQSRDQFQDQIYCLVEQLTIGFKVRVFELGLVLDKPNRVIVLVVEVDEIRPQ